MAYRIHGSANFLNTATTATISLTGTAAGDVVMFALLFGTVSAGGNPTPTTPAGMEPVGSYLDYGAGSSDGSLFLFRKTLLVDETSWTFDWGTAFQGGGLGAHAFSGRNGSAPIDVMNITLRTPASATAVYSGVTPTVDNCDIMWVGGWRSNVTGQPGAVALSGATSRVNQVGGSAVEAWRRLTTHDETQTTQAATGDKSGAFGANTGYGYSGAIALAPASADVTPPAAPTGLTATVITE